MTSLASVGEQKAWPKVTGLDMIDEPLHAWRVTPGDSKMRRVLLACALSAGVTMTGFGSIFLQNTPAIPYKLIPDLRAFGLIVSGLMLGFTAATGGAKRRRLALWGVTGYVIAFHLEEATVHWIGPYPGSITGTRVGILGTVGSLLALAAVMMMHVEVESERLRRDALLRGASDSGSSDLAAGLRALGMRRIGGIAAAVAGLSLLVVAGEKGFGNESQGGSIVLLLGGGLLFGLAVVLLRLLPKRAA